MELEFDKEIDAILRKRQGGIGVSSSDIPNHPDADSIAAFVENALPDKAKFLYMEHFADCDRCRKQLSFAISMSAEAEQPPAAIVSDAVAATIIPWYQKLFRSQNLAIAMGGLVLSFGGLIGYLALQNKDGLRSSDIAMEKAPAASAPYSTGAAADTSPANAANSANVSVSTVNAASTAANVIANSNSVMVSPVLNQPANPMQRPDEKEERKALAESEIAGVTSTDSTSADSSSSSTPPPPPPAMAPAPAKSTSEPSKTKDNELALNGRNVVEDNMTSRDVSPKAAAKRNSGPSRASGNIQQQTNTQVFDKNTTQRIGGKTFDNRNGVWYDNAYNGQATIIVARGSREYKNLDGSIKRIAENLGGTVVVMWKSKAYRVQ